MQVNTMQNKTKHKTFSKKIQNISNKTSNKKMLNILYETTKNKIAPGIFSHMLITNKKIQVPKHMAVQ